MKNIINYGTLKGLMEYMNKEHYKMMGIGLSEEEEQTIFYSLNDTFIVSIKYQILETDENNMIESINIIEVNSKLKGL